MNCQKCGSPLVPGDKFCKTCGAAAETMPEQNMMGQNNGQMNQMANPMPIEQPVNNQPAGNHPLMMNQADLNVNAMSTNFNQMNNDVNGAQAPQDNSTFFGGTLNNEQPAPMNMGMSDNMMNNQIPQPMNIPNAMPSLHQMPTNNGPMGAMTPKGNNTGKFIAIAVVVVAILAGVLIFGNLNLGGKEVGKGGEQEKEVPTYTVNVNGFSFKVPQTYIYEISNGYLMFTDESDEWIIRISVQKASFETLKTNKEQLKVAAEKRGYIATNPVVKKINGVELIEFNFEASSLKYNAAYAKLNSMYIATIEGFNQENTYDEEILKRATAIVKTAEYTGETVNMAIAIPNGALDLLTAE